jgi:large subunit ribosomal protein L9
MKVILKEDVKNLGRMGQVVNVAPGYARNYLLPRGLAVEASSRNLKEVESLKRQLEAKAQRLRHKAQELAERLSSLTLTLRAKAGEEGKLFGSITTKDIAEALKAQGIELDRKRLHLPEPIKRLGTYAVEAKLHPDVSATLNIEVVAEEV